MIQDIINKIVEKKNLEQSESKDVMCKIMEGEFTPSQIASFITALRMKGETIEEITGMADAMREKSIKIKTKSDVIDTCGTGGDRLHTFNISTATAFVVAGCGISVAKHGNRSVSSSCGSADLLEKCGVKIDVEPSIVAKCIDEIGIGFLFAPMFHPAMKYAAIPRKEIGIRTVFNILGPLTNPAGAVYQLLGVYDKNLTEKIAYVLKNLGTKSAYVVSAEDGMDEISITSPTKITELKQGVIKSYIIEPEDFGINKTSLLEISGGDAEKNYKILLNLLEGKKSCYRDAVVINSAYAILLTDKVNSLQDAIKLAEQSIDTGRAKHKLQLLKEYTNAN